jgi:outer membrane murein-binding lipoprotein Lpp
MDLAAYRTAAQEYATAWGRAHHRRFAGLDAAWDPAALHAAHAACFSHAAIDGLAAEAQTGNAGARCLWRFAVAARLRAVAAPHDAHRAREEAAGGLARLTAALAAEPDPRARRDLEEQRLALAAERLTPPAAAALGCVRDEVRALGWPSARALWTALTGVDLGALAARAERLLRETGAPPLHDARSRADVPRWHRAAWADAAFPEDALLPALRAALQSEGADPADPGFSLDVDPRPGKSPRAFVAAVRVPGEIHLVVAARGGHAAAEAAFHEAGHALLLARRDAGWRFEERHLVPAHISEAAAFRFERLVPDGGDPRVRDHIAAATVLRRRRQAARLLHELDLLDHGPIEDLKERYARRMAAATGLAWPGAPWLVDSDPLLTAADYVRADEIAHPGARPDPT